MSKSVGKVELFFAVFEAALSNQCLVRASSCQRSVPNPCQKRHAAWNTATYCASLGREVESNREIEREREEQRERERGDEREGEREREEEREGKR